MLRLLVSTAAVAVLFVTAMSITVKIANIRPALDRKEVVVFGDWPPVVSIPPEPAPRDPVPPRVGPIVAAVFSSDGKQILTGDWESRVTLWSVDADKPLWSVRVTNEKEPRYLEGRLPYGAIGVAFAADGKRVFCAWALGVAEVDREKGTILRTTKFSKPVVTNGNAFPPMVLFLPESDECLYYGGDERLVRFDFQTGKRHDKFDIRLANFSCLALTLSPDRQTVLTYNCSAGYLTERVLATGEQRRKYDLDDGFLEAGFTPDGEFVWIQQDRIVLFRRRNAERVPLPEGLAQYRGNVWFSPDGKHAVALARGERKEDWVDVLAVADGKVLRKFSSQGIWYSPLFPPDPKGEWLQPRPGLAAFSPDGRTVLLTGTGRRMEDARLGLWDIETGKHLRTFSEHPR